MSKNAKPATTKPAEIAEAAAPKSKKKLIIIIVAALVIAGVAGWYFTKGGNDKPHTEEVKVAPPQHPIFIALDPFTVNLQKETSDQYLQVGITLKLFEAGLEEKIKASLPEIRSRILLLLATKTASELSTPEGKASLIDELIISSNGVLGIVNKPSHTTPAMTASQVAGASQVVEAGTTTEHAAPTDAAAEHTTPAAHEKEEKKGIVDVLFTSFIIQ